MIFSRVPIGLDFMTSSGVLVWSSHLQDAQTFTVTSNTDVFTFLTAFYLIFLHKTHENYEKNIFHFFCFPHNKVEATAAVTLDTLVGENKGSHGHHEDH